MGQPEEKPYWACEACACCERMIVRREEGRGGDRRARPRGGGGAGPDGPYAAGESGRGTSERDVALLAGWRA